MSLKKFDFVVFAKMFEKVQVSAVSDDSVVGDSANLALTLSGATKPLQKFS